MAVKKKAKRKLSQKQLFALAKGRSALAKNRSASRKTDTAKKKKTKKVKIKSSDKGTINQGEKKIMAKEKVTKRKTSLRSSVSNLGRGAKSFAPTIKTVALSVGGAVAAGAIANKLPLTNAKLKAATPLLAGIVLAGLLGKRNTMIKEIGTGMAVVGAMSLLKQYMPNVPVLAGEDTIVYIPEGYVPPMNGEYTRLGYSGETVNFGAEEEYLSPASM